MKGLLHRNTGDKAALASILPRVLALTYRA